MDKQKIIQLCQHILKSANEIETHGETNFAHLIGICQVARQIAAEVKKPEEATQSG